MSYDGKVVSLQDAQVLPDAGAAAAPADLDRRQRPQAHAAARRPVRRRLARLGHAQLAARRPTPGSTSWPPRPAATRRRSCGPSSLSLDDLDTARKHAAKWRDAGYGYLVCGWPGAGRAQVEAFARDVMPELHRLNPASGAAPAVPA